MMKRFGLLAVLVLSGVMYCNAQQLPSVQVKDINGKTIDTSTLSNDGKPFIISFFATWCKPCLRELEAIKEVYEDWQEETGVKLYAISIDDAQNALKVGPDAKAKGWEYEILLDTNSEFRHALGGSLIPAAFIVDGNGKIVHSRTGYTNGSEEHLIEEVRKLIAE
jgi:peroxiredoxin